MEEQIKDKVQSKLVLAPNKSVFCFNFGDKVDNYFNFSYEFISKEELGGYNDLYDFVDIPITIAVDDDNCIESIRCDFSCILEDRELINMSYQMFLEIFKIEPDEVDYLYTYGPKVNGRNYAVYTFSPFGIMIWVWRKRIRCVNALNMIEDESM